MKVLAVIDTLGYGGAERLLASLLPELVKRGIDCEVAAAGGPYSLAAELEQVGIPVHRLDLGHRWLVGRAARALATICRARDIEVVWGHLYFGNLYAACTRLALRRLKIVWTLHTPGYAASPPDRLWDRFRKTVEAIAARRLVDAIVAVSDAVAADYRQTFGWDIQRIYNGIALSNLPPPISSAERSAVRSSFSVADDDFLLVTPARFAPEKGHWVLCDALGILREQRGWLPACIAVGTGAKTSAIAERLRSHALMQLYEPLPQKELFRLLQAADVVVLPSLREPFGLAAAEGMAMGVPAILSDVDGLKELAGNGAAGLIVPVGDPMALADAIWRLRTEPELRHCLAVAGRARVLENFDISKLATSWATLFSALRPSASP